MCSEQRKQGRSTRINETWRYQIAAVPARSRTSRHISGDADRLDAVQDTLRQLRLLVGFHTGILSSTEVHEAASVYRVDMNLVLSRPTGAPGMTTLTPPSAVPNEQKPRKTVNVKNRKNFSFTLHEKSEEGLK